MSLAKFDMKLYHFPVSPNCRKVEMVIHHLHIACEKQLVDPSQGHNRTPEYLQLNPNGKVPTLVDGDFVLWESPAIMQYLASKVPEQNLWPKSDRVRADIARWQFWLHSHLIPTISPYIRENIVQPLSGKQPDTTALAAAEIAFKPFALVLNQHLESRRYLVNEELTLADLAVAAHWGAAKLARAPIETYHGIADWLERIESLPCYQATIPDLSPFQTNRSTM